MRLFAQDLTTDTLQHIAARGLSEAGGPKPLLLRVLVDLFMRRPSHSDEEIQHFAEIACTVLPGATRDEIDHAAIRLARHPSAPGELLDLLAERAGEGALVLLAQSRRLATPVLHHAAREGSAQAALALASRDDLDATSIALLAARPEPEVLLQLVQNASAPVCDVLTTLMARARTDHALAQALSKRLPYRSECWPLFLDATRPSRLIMMGAARQSARIQDHAATQALAANAATALQRLEAAAQNHPTGFAGTLAEVFSCSPALARRIAEDPGGEPLILALRSLDAPAENILRLAKCLNPELTQGQMIWHRSLAAGLSRHVAQRLITAVTDMTSFARHPSQHEEQTVQRRRLAGGRRENFWIVSLRMQ